MRRGFLTAVVFVALGLALVGGIVKLFTLRFEGGDMYPPYSALRADPLGTKAFADALGRLPGVSVRQSFHELRPGQAPPCALFYAGLGTHARLPATLPRQVADGTRLVITMLPVGPSPAPVPSNSPGAATPTPTPTPKPKSDRKKSKQKSPAATPSEQKEEMGIAPEKTFGYVIRTLIEPKAPEKKPSPPPVAAPAILRPGAPGLEPQIPWHSSAYFAKLTPPWHVIYECDGQPVIIERLWGDGSIVLASDSYFLSNEALYRSDRPAKLLAWLTGPHHLLLFDEEHDGLVEESGVSTLLRRYRLEGVMGGLAFIVLLYLWQQAHPLVPPEKSTAREAVVSGRSADEGLVTLLRRSLPPGQLMETCLAEWRRSVPATEPERERLNTATAAVQAEGLAAKNPAEAYRRISAALHHH